MIESTATIRFVIEDDFHAEKIGPTYTDLPAAVAELRRLADLPWDQAPNRSPCVSWDVCGRDYWIREYDMTHTPWTQLRRLFVLVVAAGGVKWVVPADEIETRFAALSLGE